MRTIDGKPEYRNGLVSDGVWRGGGQHHLGVLISSGGAPLSFWEFPFSWGCSLSLQAGGEIQVIFRRRP